MPVPPLPRCRERDGTLKDLLFPILLLFLLNIYVECEKSHFSRTPRRVADILSQLGSQVQPTAK